jgi:predicted dehydrogenase/threonine dehydrogenase-like Zn-dependent dehydrogenase
MKQVVQSARTGVLSLREVPAPRVKAGHVLVATTASLISAGTERMVVDFAKKSLLAKARSRPDLVKKVISKVQRDGLLATLEAVRARLDEPLPLGYSAAGKVVAVGSGLEGQFRPGDRVAIAGAGVANHAELNVVPRNLVAAIPEDVSDEEASFSTLGAIALNGVRLLEPRLGDIVAVLGVGLVGQLALQLLALQGCRVIALDYDERKLELARRVGGAEAVWNLANGDPTEMVLSFTGGLGCDAVLIAAATETSEPFETAASIARDRAKVSLVGIVGTEFPYREFMKKELSIIVSRSYGPGRYDDDYEKRDVKYPVGWVRWTETENLSECVRLMGHGRRARLDVASLITHRFDFSEAEAAYRLVTEATEPHLGVVLKYTSPPPEEEARALPPPAPRAAAKRGDKCVLGVIGAGSFARTKLLPALRSDRRVVLHTLATQRGASAEDSQRKFGFAHGTADANAVFDDPEINAVLIATPHSSHAELTSRALAAGKSVLVEKPLALSREELNRVIAARNGSAGFFQIGFNRRFAPMVRATRDHLARHEGAKMVLLRVNAGQLPAESWQRASEEGGGRILGEVCHFIDLARFLVGAPILTVHADAARPSRSLCEDLTVTLRFADGSLATIVYSALGDTAYSKERFEAFAAGTVVALDNFRTLEVASAGHVRRRVARVGQDKGHKAEVAAFVAAVVEGGPPPVPEDELVETSLATIAVLESLRDGTTASLCS